MNNVKCPLFTEDGAIPHIHLFQSASFPVWVFWKMSEVSQGTLSPLHTLEGGSWTPCWYGLHWVSTNEICAQPKRGMVRPRLLHKTLEVVYSSRFPLVGRASLEEKRSGKPPKCHFWLTRCKETAKKSHRCSFSGKFTPPSEDSSVQTRTSKATEHSQNEVVQF